MSVFSIDPEVLAARKDRARERALKREGLRLVSDLGAGKLLRSEVVNAFPTDQRDGPLTLLR